MKWKKRIIKITLTLASIYILLCTFMYLFQEKFIFHPKKLSADFKFNYPLKFEEKFISTNDGKKLNGLLFKSDSAKGLVFYLHGNAGALDTWGNVAETYTGHHYDVFILDYRSYGKSEGDIENEKQFFGDIQAAYNELKNSYDESKIVILGYSIGTCPAAMLASKNHPAKLILLAPYFSLVDMMNRSYPVVPKFLLKYPFETYKYVKDLKVPLTIFHGNTDAVVPFRSSEMLKEYFKEGDRLIMLEGQSHNNIGEHTIYRQELKKLLE